MGADVFFAAQQEPAKDKFRYITVGSLDDPEALPPKGEFFCKLRDPWMPEVEGKTPTFTNPTSSSTSHAPYVSFVREIARRGL